MGVRAGAWTATAGLIALAAALSGCRLDAPLGKIPRGEP